jgi:hypothetical protein
VPPHHPAAAAKPSATAHLDHLLGGRLICVIE